MRSYTAILDLTGRPEDRALRRAGRYLQFAALLPCPVLLIADLGRPERFHHMLRVFRPRSMMNQGSCGRLKFVPCSNSRLLLSAHATGVRRAGSGESVSVRARLGVTLALVSVGAVMLAASTPAFATRANLTAVALGMSLDAIVAVGMTVLIVSGGFDLSVGSVMALAGAAAALVATIGGDSQGAALAALAAGFATGAAVGTINGAVVAWLGVNPLVATLATMSIARGLVLVLTGGYGLSNLPPAFDAIGQTQFLGLQTPIWAMFLLVPLGDLLLRRSRWLRASYAIGGSERAAHLSGVPVARLKWLNYVLTGTLAGLAGVLLAARLGTATVSAGMNAELRVMAAVVLGGASLAGGEGTVIGSFLGVLLMALIGNALNLFAISPNWQPLITGGVLLFAVTLDAAGRRFRRGT